MYLRITESIAMVEPLSNVHEALDSIPRALKQKTKDLDRHPTPTW